jgi:hypothetical protein
MFVDVNSAATVTPAIIPDSTIPISNSTSVNP